MKNLSHQIAIVTGAASGMGLATAALLAKQNIRVVLLDKNIEVARQIAKDISGYAIEADVADEKSVESAFQESKSKVGLASICIHCAGVAPAKKIISKNEAMPLSDFKKVIDINLIGTFNIMRLAARDMALLSEQGQEDSIIINTASIAAFEGQIGQVAYSASKAGIVGMTLPAARELARYQIRVVTIAPGVMSTPLMESMPENVKDSLTAQIPYPARFGLPEEFASLALHIIQNPYINGEVIRLDGALRMSAK